ncbi:Ribonuclease HI [invertebrate metagenome]|uniref:ribonuclease H n=1 Tax=invertebrate metagenome TaxID=1711999 RepID=A0A484HCQ0_9ZZZZ
MELTAVIEALNALQYSCRVNLYTDSQYVQKGICHWMQEWKKCGWKTADRRPVKNQDLWRNLEALATRHHVTWHWIRGHAGHPDNERADALAHIGLRKTHLKVY